MVIWLLWLLDLLTIVLLIAICATRAGTFSAFTLAVVVLYFVLKAIPMPFILLTLPVVVPYLVDICGVTLGVLYIASRHVSGDDPLASLELAFAVLAILVSTVEISVRSLYKFYVTRKLYDAWLDTFDQSWSLETETGWTKVLRLGGQMMSAGKPS